MRGNTKMWLENYEKFLENCNEKDLNVNHLNQIIYMHGFTKLHRSPKDFIANTVKTINLLVPSRSTLELKDTISPCAFLEAEELMEDLSTLDWKECLVQSIETLSSGKGKRGLNLDQGTNCTSSIVPESFSKLKVGKKRKVVNVNAITLALACSPSSAPHFSRGSC